MFMKNVIELNNKFYTENLINHWIEDFKEYADISYYNWLLSIEWETETEIKEIFNEFMNYIIWLYNETI